MGLLDHPRRIYYSQYTTIPSEKHMTIRTVRAEKRNPRLFEPLPVNSIVELWKVDKFIRDALVDYHELKSICDISETDLALHYIPECRTGQGLMRYINKVVSPLYDGRTYVEVFIIEPC